MKLTRPQAIFAAGLAILATMSGSVALADSASAPNALGGSCSGTSVVVTPIDSATINANCVAATTTTTTAPPTTTSTTVPPTTTTSTTQPAPTTTTTAPPVTTTTTTQPPNTNTFAVQGLYTGSVSSATSLGKTLGLNPLKGYSFYCDGNSWSSIAQCSPATGLPAGTVQLVGLNLAPDTPKGTGDAAASSNLSTYQSVAHNFIGTNVVFRLGWEMDGNWFPWGNGVNGNTPTSFAFATAQVIPAMKAIDPAAQFDFSVNTGTSTVAQMQGFMGNNQALWTYIGGDHYDYKGGGGNASTMKNVVTYASQLGKSVSVGEWGLNGASDVKFDASMCQFITNPAASSAANGFVKYTVGPTSYFSANLSPGINSNIAQFPADEAAYKADCG